MAYNNGLITAPVSINDVRQCLGNSSTDLGTLCTANNINKWARFKPVKYSSINTVTQRSGSTWNLTGLSLWWKANNGLCGLNTTIDSEFGNSLTNTDTFMYKLIHGQLGWNYEHPTGGLSAPYRLQDFADYYHYAEAPYGDIKGTNLDHVYIDTSNKATIGWDVPPALYENLALSDLVVEGTSLTEFYLGVIIWNNSNHFNVYTSSDKFSTGNSLTITMTNMNDKEGTWNLLPFFSLNQTNSSGTFDAGGKFISMDISTPFQVTFTKNGSNAIDDTLSTVYWDSNGKVAYRILIENTTSVVHNYSSILLTVYGGHNLNDEGTWIAEKTISNISVPANSHGDTAFVLSSDIYGVINASKGSYPIYWVIVADKSSGSTIRGIKLYIDDNPETPD